MTVYLPDGTEVQEGVEEKVVEAVAYAGPDIDGIVKHGQIFSGGVLPGKLEEAIKQTPAIGGLIVPFDSLAQVTMEVRKPAGRYRMLYDIVLGVAKTR